MHEETGTKSESKSWTANSAPLPVLLLAYSPADSESMADRWPLTEELTIGRKRPATLIIADKYLSKPHFRITPDNESFYVEDMNSSNETFINGMPLVGRQKLRDSDVVRAGRSIFVFHEDGEPLLAPSPPDIYGIGGRFHVAPLLKEIRRYSNSHSHVLLSGPSGSGKELAAAALAKMSRRELIIHNVARLRSDSSAEATLFGVGPKVFTDVGERAGLIELADNKTLFLDEAHALPHSVQRMMLRVMEDWCLTRVGETETRKVDVRFIMASNDLSSPDFGIATDLLNRMRVVKIPSLQERVADIPSIFRYLLQIRLEEAGIDAAPVFEKFFTDTYECLCLDGFEKENTRGLIRLVDDIIVELKNGVLPDNAIRKVFTQHYKKSLVLCRKKRVTEKTAKILETFRLESDTLDLIKDIYYEKRGIITAVVEELREHDVKTSHRRVGKIIDALGLQRAKRQR